MTIQRLWYVKRGDRVQGPFPEAQVAAYIVLGRVGEQDALSLDNTYWHKSDEVPELVEAVNNLLGIPAAASDDPAWREERMKATLRWLDDRKSPDPRGREMPEQATQWQDRRAGKDRRLLPETVEEHAYREGRAQFESSLRGRHQRYGVAVAALLAVAIMAAGAVLILQPVNPIKVGLRMQAPDCDQAPARGVNWSGCNKDGYLLAGADLRGAELVGTSLRQANLGYADLTQANLSRADLTAADLAGARLGNAIWVDGRVCATDSIGGCK